MRKADFTPLEWAAIKWWRGNRPLVYTLKKHLENPTVNMNGPNERDLAKNIAAAIRSRK